MAQDERVKGKEWDLSKRCPVCEDIKDGKVTDEGEQVFIPGTKKPFFVLSVDTWRFASFGESVLSSLPYFSNWSNSALDPPRNS